MATRYDIVPTSKEVEHEGSIASRRQDDSGLWNFLQAWYLSLLHLVASLVFVIWILKWIDGHNFQTGSPPSLFQTESPLYQTQINGLVSLALIMIRLLASSCTALLVWRMILVLLEKQGMTLTELTRLNNYRIPILPGTDSKSRFLWSLWAMMVVFSLWPPNFAAPLANSSLAWNPSSEIVGPTRSVSMTAMNEASYFWQIGAPEFRTTSVLRAALMTGTDPNYAFNIASLPLRRYFQTLVNMTDNSTIGTTFPFFNADLHWVDASNDIWERLSQSTYTDFANPVAGEYALTRHDGSVILVRDSPFNPNGDLQTPKEATVFSAQRLVAVKVSAYENYTILDGSPNSADSPCANGSFFGRLPGFDQLQVDIVKNDVRRSGDCYQIGNVNITAGLYPATDCNVLSAGTSKSWWSGTCSMSLEPTKIKGDWAAPVVWEMLSETMKNIVIMNNTYHHMKSGLDDYTTGMLTLAYHAAWGAATDYMGTGNENGSFRRAESMVQAGVSRGKIYAWLAMNMSLLMAAVFVYVVLGFSSVKAVRDTTLTPLMADFSAITNSQRGSGLRNAAALSKNDKKLPRIKLNDDNTYNFVDEVDI